MRQHCPVCDSELAVDGRKCDWCGFVMVTAGTHGAVNTRENRKRKRPTETEKLPRPIAPSLPLHPSRSSSPASSLAGAFWIKSVGRILVLIFLCLVLIGALFASVWRWNQFHAGKAVVSYENNNNKGFLKSTSKIVRLNNFYFMSSASEEAKIDFISYLKKHNRCRNCGGSGECPHCIGTGVCPVCHGHTPVTKSCPKTLTSRCQRCGGDGYCAGRDYRGVMHRNGFGCPNCGGNGKPVMSGILGTLINRGKKGTGKITETCSKCRGTGRVLEYCDACNNGECRKCNGRKTCMECNGSGVSGDKTEASFGFNLLALF